MKTIDNLTIDILSHLVSATDLTDPPKSKWQVHDWATSFLAIYAETRSIIVCRGNKMFQVCIRDLSEFKNDIKRENGVK